jgi:hypothetical protein
MDSYTNTCIVCFVLLVIAVSQYSYRNLNRLPPPTRRTVRVRKIPNTCLNVHQFRTLFEANFVENNNIARLSLAPESSFSTSTEYNVATVCFLRLPSYLTALDKSLSRNVKVKLDIPSNGIADVEIDVSFHGFTTLFQSQDTFDIE